MSDVVKATPELLAGEIAQGCVRALVIELTRRAYHELLVEEITSNRRTTWDGAGMDALKADIEEAQLVLSTTIQEFAVALGRNVVAEAAAHAAALARESQ